MAKTKKQYEEKYPPKEGDVFGRSLMVMRYFHHTGPEVVRLTVDLGTEAYDGCGARIAEWRNDEAKGECWVRASVYVGQGQYRMVSGTFPSKLEQLPLRPPGRNWEWVGWKQSWVNKATRKERAVL